MSSSPSPSPLSTRQENEAAAWRELAGHSTVARYGEMAVEHRALEEGRALVDRSWVECVEITGEDRRRFLNGLVTCDVQALTAGQTTYGFFTSLQGRCLADVTVLDLDDVFWLELPPGQAGKVLSHLGKYVIADRIDMARLAATTSLALVGEASWSAAGLGDWAPEPGGVSRGSIADRPVMARQGTVWGLPAFVVWAGREDVGVVWDALRERGLAAVGADALEVARVEQGSPLFGVDFGPESFPQETGLVDVAVSFDKGCYLGQEVVARIHYRGQAQRSLVGLRFAAESPPPPGTELQLAGRKVGAVSSAVRSLRFGAVLGLGTVHRRGAEPGTRLEVDGRGVVEVAALPFEA